MPLTPLEGLTVIMIYITLYAVLRALSYKWRMERLERNNKEMRKELRR